MKRNRQDAFTSGIPMTASHSPRSSSLIITKIQPQSEFLSLWSLFQFAFVFGFIDEAFFCVYGVCVGGGGVVCFIPSFLLFVS